MGDISAKLLMQYLTGKFRHENDIDRRTILCVSIINKKKTAPSILKEDMKLPRWLILHFRCVVAAIVTNADGEEPARSRIAASIFGQRRCFRERRKLSLRPRRRYDEGCRRFQKRHIMLSSRLSQ